MKNAYKLFFAIPFDTATRSLYANICKTIKTKYPQIKETVIGKDEVAPSPDFIDIETFKNQNEPLINQFIVQIQESDIVIADLTHNNPNVHVELGIALMEKKNILRVTGRAIKELGFDIQHLESYQYKSKKQLLKKICDYLDVFFEIKKLSNFDGNNTQYHKDSVLLQLRPDANNPLDSKPSGKNIIIRDGTIKVKFKIIEEKNLADNWFGILFRAGDVFQISSYLVYVRKNGKMAVVEFPGVREIQTFDIGNSINDEETLIIAFENNFLEIQIAGKTFIYDKLVYQQFGKVFQAAWNSNVDVLSLEMICRDTIKYP